MLPERCRIPAPVLMKGCVVKDPSFEITEEMARSVAAAPSSTETVRPPDWRICSFVPLIVEVVAEARVVIEEEPWKKSRLLLATPVMLAPVMVMAALPSVWLAVVFTCMLPPTRLMVLSRSTPVP